MPAPSFVTPASVFARAGRALTASLVLLVCAMAMSCGPSDGGLSVEVTFSSTVRSDAAQGRLLLFFAPDDDSTREPWFRVTPRLSAIPIFGMDVEAWQPDTAVHVGSGVFGYPVASLPDLPPGTYEVQALLHLYEDFELANGRKLKLPMDRGEGQRWAVAPGNLFSTPQRVDVEKGSQTVRIRLDQVNPEIERPEDSEFVRHVQVRSELLSDFWGRDMFLGANVLVPRGFDQDTDLRYPLMLFHGHFARTFNGFRTEPPAPDLECRDSRRFGVECYNRVMQQEAYDFYRRWVSDDFPRYLVVEVQHANPYYDDSYAVNSENLGPYGDAIMTELLPEVERRFRGIGEGWARFTYGGSTGGWEALAAQVFYPEEFNGAFAACPDPIDFRAFMTVDIYEDDNAFFYPSAFKEQLRPGWRNREGHVHASVRDFSDMERVLGSRIRSGNQMHVWQAVYSPAAEDGYPRPLWDEVTGEIDREVAAHWRENYDLRHVMERDWKTLGPKLEGKVHLYTGDMDNYYLNNAVRLTEEFLEATTDPYYAGEVDYGDGAEHCWNGDQANPNHISRLRYNTFYLPKILRRVEAAAPPGADLRWLRR